MPGIPGHVIDQIRDAADITQVVGRYVTLKKRGRGFVGLCPFHHEKTPSFSVNPERQIYHCFGCGKGGNVFGFLMEYEKLSFVDAVHRLAEETGIEIPKSESVRRQESENERLQKANAVAQRYFRHQLAHAPKAVTEYLTRRGLDAETVERFGIGFAPPGWDGLLTFLKKGNWPLDLYLKLGLLLTSQKSGRPYDRFRNRLMFPIHNAAGKVVAFGGRDLSDDPNTPKYINSPESPIYYKSRVLYGLNVAREAIRTSGEAVFVEGYMDVIQLHRHGVANAVATSGTALTAEHAALIRRYTERVVLCYDADRAGIAAAVRGGEVLFQNQVETDVLILPEGEDPDSYVQGKGAEAFRELIKGARPYLDFRLAQVRERYDLERAGERSQAVAEVLELLAPLTDPVRNDYFVERISENLRLPAAMLRNELDKKRRARARREQVRMSDPPDGQPAESLPPDAPAEGGGEDGPLVFAGNWGAEKGVILLLIQFHGEISGYVFDNLEEDDFLNPDFQRLFRFLRSVEARESSGILHAVLEHIGGGPLQALLLREIEETNRTFAKPALYLQGCIKQMKIARNQARIDIHNRRLKTLKSSDPDYMVTLRELQTAMVELRQWRDVECVDDEEGDPA